MIAPTLHLIDANNALRRSFENGKPVRMILPLYPIDHPEDPRVFIFDGPYARNFRRRLYHDYKARRDTATPRVTGAFEFLDEVRDNLLPHLSNALIIRRAGVEADDIIAGLVQQERASKKFARVVIDSNDGDLWALTGNGDGVSVQMTSPPKWYPQVKPEEVRLYKTLKGDSSDNIPGLKGFGDRAWETLTEEVKALWHRFLEGDDQILELLEGSLKPAQKEWVGKEENRKMLRIWWKVIKLYPETAYQLSKEDITVCTPNRAEYEAAMSKYLWS